MIWSTSICGSFGFLYYLWGIETRLFLYYYLSRCCLFILPMRNWNYLQLCWYFGKLRLFILPMRNWNLSRGKDGIIVWSYFLYYLWGIETNLQNVIYFMFVSFFLYYLWGIETGVSVGSGEKIITFYITYEELKQSRAKQSRYWNDNKSFLYYLWGIETIKSVFDALLQNTLFILPMRNWNSDKPTKLFAFGWNFLYYLWGIETAKI